MPTDAQSVYTVQLKKDVERTMRKLPVDLRRRIQQAINAIAEEPRHPDGIAVKGFDSVYQGNGARRCGVERLRTRRKPPPGGWCRLSALRDHEVSLSFRVGFVALVDWNPPFYSW